MSRRHMKGFRISNQASNKFDKVFKRWVMIELEGGARIQELTEAAFLEEVIDMLFQNAFPERFEDEHTDMEENDHAKD